MDPVMMAVTSIEKEITQKQSFVETKGYRQEDAKAKEEAMEVFWVPGGKRLKNYERWAFVELKEVYKIESEFETKVEAEFGKMIHEAVQ